MLLFIIDLFTIFPSGQSPFVSFNNCKSNETFVINRLDGAVCHNDRNYIQNSIQYMISRKKFYELIPNNISEYQEFICKVNSTQYSGVLSVNETVLQTDNTKTTVPIICHVPDIADNFYSDVEVWNYKPSTNTAEMMQVVNTIVPGSVIEWNAYLNHVQFSRSENIAGLKGNHGSTILRWDDATYNPCGACSKTTSGLIFNNTFNAENYCLLRDNFCVYSGQDSVNCTRMNDLPCFDPSALNAPAPPPRLPPPPFPPGLAPAPPPESRCITEVFNNTITGSAALQSFALKLDTTIDLSNYENSIPDGTQFFATGFPPITKNPGEGLIDKFLYSGIGYWVKIIQDFQLTYCGQIFENSYYTTFNDTAAGTAALQSFALQTPNYVNLSNYNIPDGTQFFATGFPPITKNPGEDFTSQKLHVGRGYWVKVVSDFVMFF